jgi:hypothetical protein
MRYRMSTIVIASGLSVCVTGALSAQEGFDPAGEIAPTSSAQCSALEKRWFARQRELSERVMQCSRRIGQECWNSVPCFRRESPPGAHYVSHACGVEHGEVVIYKSCIPAADAVTCARERGNRAVKACWDQLGRNQARQRWEDRQRTAQQAQAERARQQAEAARQPTPLPPRVPTQPTVARVPPPQQPRCVGDAKTPECMAADPSQPHNPAAEQLRLAAEQYQRAMEERNRQAQEARERIAAQQHAVAEANAERQRAVDEGFQRGQTAVRQERAERAARDISTALQSWQAPARYASNDAESGPVGVGGAAAAPSLVDPFAVEPSRSLTADLNTLSTDADRVATFGPASSRATAEEISQVATLASKVTLWADDIGAITSGDPIGFRDALLHVGDVTLNSQGREGLQAVGRIQDAGMDSLVEIGRHGFPGDGDPQALERAVNETPLRFVEAIPPFQRLSTAREINDSLRRLEALPTNLEKRFDELRFRLKVRLRLACDPESFGCW